SPAAKKKKFLISHKEHSESVHEIPEDAAEWESLFWKARPAFERICYHLRTNEDCCDLSNFSMVSKPFRNEVMEFMKKKGNQPGLKYVSFDVAEGRLWVSIHLFPPNLPFHDLNSVTFGRFNRSMNGNNPNLKVQLHGSEDQIIEQPHSSPIWHRCPLRLYASLLPNSFASTKFSGITSSTRNCLMAPS
ncbi:hypothetical protein PMAYCL1PPCAC_27935, partial [Pristionchus mayeri]